MTATRRIEIYPFAGAVTVDVDDCRIVRSTNALVLDEAGYPPVFYVPRTDVDLTQLVSSDHTSHCPYKGDASYYSFAHATAPVSNMAWSYETPLASVAPIAGHLAFYGDKCRIEAAPAQAT